MIWRNLFRRKTRTLLTVTGIAIGIAAVVALRAMADGLTDYYDVFSGTGVDLLITQEESVDVSFSAIREDLGEQLAALPEVKEIAGTLITITSVESLPYFIMFGYDPQEFAIQHFKIVEGNGLSRSGTARVRTQRSLGRDHGEPLILGRMAAQNLEKSVGDTLRLYDATFRIVGIYETGKPFEESGAVISLTAVQALAGKPRQVNAYQIKLRDPALMDQLRQRIRRRFPDLTVSAAADFGSDQEMLAYVHGFTWGVSLLALLIGGVGVMNTLLMSVFERTREIGVLRALGWPRRRILAMVLEESLALSTVGGLSGMGLGIGAVKLLARAPATAGLLSGSFSQQLLLQALIIVFALGVLGGLYPAWRASQLVPLTALQYDAGSSGQDVGRHIRVGGMALRNLARQQTRTLLTAVAVGVAILGIVLLQGLTEGLVNQVSALALENEVDLVGMETDTSMDLSTIDERVIQRMAAIPGVRRAEGFLTGYAATSELPFFVVFGYHPAGYGIRHFTIVEGEPLTAGRQMILGRVASQNLRKDVGDTLRIFSTSFRIVGLYETGVPFEDGGGVIRLHDAQSLFSQPRKVSFVAIKLEDPKQAETVHQHIEAQFPEVSVSTAANFAEGTVDIQATRSMTWAIVVLAILVSSVGIVNTMVMSVFERTREIGVLRALGWRKTSVLRMILGESIALSLASGLIGLGAAVALGLALNRVPVVAGFMELSFSAAILVQALAIALFLGSVGGLYPAWRASRLQPLEALRYE